MSLRSPLQSQSQFSYDTSTPPPPPPKPSTHSSGRGTPLTGPPLPPPPHGQSPHPSITSNPQGYSGSPGPNPPNQHAFEQEIPPPEPGWLPDIVKQQTTTDLTTLLRDPSLQSALLNNPATTHPSLPASTAQLNAILAANLQLAQQLVSLESHLRSRRDATQSRLLALRALERQWRAKQSEQDAALRDFSAPALYQRLVAAVGEGDEVCRGMEESFLHARGGAGGEGEKMSEREVMEFVRRYREARKIAFLRRERKERWDEGRVGGWR
ncbi:hypothetical protein NA57DRAFT_68335 [Rhizodiscina lignyota]|uniref:VPS37 C-terminal domain-containing protein n=1 Tax=Rhizodiscina lignyota TaxID=1504668 RepID=A0A9P4M4Z0_9PEZI|nr:hypothetical protein NA57DRAFT_68335 [Rhizodiscina lignyota]